MISVIIYTYNSQEQVKDAIRSAKLLSPNVTVIDVGSLDHTRTIAGDEEVEVHIAPYTPYVEPVREFGINHSKGDWFFVLDADERITPELAKEIRETIENTDHTHFKVPRKNLFGSKVWLKHGGWWPDRQARLFKRSAFKGWPKEIHSAPQVDGTQGTLTNPLLHYSHGDLHSMVEKTIVFEDLESDLLLDAGRPVSLSTFFRKFLGELYRRLLKNRGFLDGKPGIIESVYQAFSKTVTYLYLYEKKKSRPV
jgi:hypothetical protein